MSEKVSEFLTIRSFIEQLKMHTGRKSREGVKEVLGLFPEEGSHRFCFEIGRGPLFLVL